MTEEVAASGLANPVEPAAAAEAGGELTRAREAKGLSIADVAQLLKFAPRQLEALEQDRFEALPGATFARGLVRSYARLLKLDPGPIVERLAGRLDTPDAGRLAERYREPVPFSDGARRSTLTYLGFSIGILVVVGGLAYEWYHERAASRPLTFVMAAKGRLDAPAPAYVVSTAEASQTPAPAPTMERENTPLLPEATGEKVVPGSGRIVLHFDRESWVEVKDGNQRLLVSSLHSAGSVRVVQGRPPFTLVIGNAQHVRLTYDDRLVDLQPYVKVEVARLTLQ